MRRLDGRPIARSARSIEAERKFRDRVAAAGATLVDAEWLGVKTEHRAICINGHSARVIPHALRHAGLCAACAGRDQAAAWSKFTAEIAAQGAALLDPHWLGSKARHWVVCSKGHHSGVTPSDIASGRGVCGACAERDTFECERRFREAMTALGARMLGEWRGGAQSHRFECRDGHVGSIVPSALLSSSQSLCKDCAGKNKWDVFYVVLNKDSSRVKFGVTNGDGKARLATHRRSGYRDVVRLFPGVPMPGAADLERATAAALRDAGAAPVQGREYYDASALALILDIVDGSMTGRLIQPAIV